VHTVQSLDHAPPAEEVLRTVFPWAQHSRIAVSIYPAVSLLEPPTTVISGHLSFSAVAGRRKIAGRVVRVGVGTVLQRRGKEPAATAVPSSQRPALTTREGRDSHFLKSCQSTQYRTHNLQRFGYPIDP